MVRFDHCGFSTETALYNVRINSSLCKEIYGADLLGFFLEDADKFLTDNLTFRLGLCNTCKLVVISLLCVYTDKVQVKLTVRSEYAFNLITLIFTEKAMIYEYTGKLLADRSGKKSCCYRGIYTTGQSKKNFSIADFLTDLFDRVLNKGIHLPVSGAFTDTKYEVGQHGLSFNCVQYFRMELDRVQFLLLILCSCYRTVCSVCSDLESRCSLRNVICMAHPADCFVGYVFEDFGIFFINEKLCLAVLADICFLNFSAKDMHHELCSVAKSKYRNTKLE